MGHDLTVSTHTSETIADAWDDLADRVGASPFLRRGWVEAWSRAFGRGPLEVRAIHSCDGGLRGLVPLERRSGALHSPTNWHTPEFGILALDPGAASDLVTSLLDERPRRLDLGFVDPPTGDLVAHVSEGFGRPSIVRTIQRSPYLPLDGTWEQYRRSLGKKMRGNLGRRRRQLEARGSVRFEVVGGSADVAEALEEGLQVEASSWKGDGGTAIASHPQTLRFYAEVARRAADAGILRLRFLRLDERPIAFGFCLDDGRREYLVKSGFDPEYRDFGPGKLLREEIVRSAYEGGRGSVEFLGTDVPWKLEWTDRVRERVRVQVFGRGPIGRLDRSVQRYVRPWAKSMKDRWLSRGGRTVSTSTS